MKSGVNDITIDGMSLPGRLKALEETAVRQMTKIKELKRRIAALESLTNRLGGNSIRITQLEKRVEELDHSKPRAA